MIACNNIKLLNGTARRENLIFLILKLPQNKKIDILIGLECKYNDNAKNLVISKDHRAWERRQF